MIPLLKPNPPAIAKWTKYLQSSYDQSVFSNGGPCVQLLEERLRDYLGLKETPVLMCNATIALTIALQAMNIKSVLMPSFTFSATPHSALNAGCEIHFADIEDDLQMALPRRLGVGGAPWAEALVVVQALGYVCDYAKYEEYAYQNDVKLIFDSAAALGANYMDGRKVGLAGDCEIFSLHITKTFGIGEGALVTSHNKEFLDRCRQISNFGFENNQSTTVGTNAKCSEFHAAVGLAVLDEIDEKIARKKLVSDTYKELLKDLPVRLLEQNSGYQVFPVIFRDNATREKVRNAFNLNFIGSRLYYVPIHRQPFFFSGERFPKTDDYANRILCIPFFETINQEEQELVVKIISDNISS